MFISLLGIKAHRKIGCFFENIALIHKYGIWFTVEITPDDSYLPYIEEIKDICRDRIGALCHVSVSRDERKKGYPLLSKLSREQFIESWKTFDSELFKFKESIFEVRRKEFCYAGMWGITVDLGLGTYRQCYKGKVLGNIYDLESPLRFIPIGHHCREGHCFNGHAFLGFGMIPEFDAPSYACKEIVYCKTGING